MYVLEIEDEVNRLGWASGRKVGFSIVDIPATLSN